MNRFYKSKKNGMKRFLMNLLVLFGLFICTCSSANAEEQAGLSFEINGSESKYTVAVRIDGNPNLEMLQFCVDYDDSKLKLESAMAGDLFGGLPLPTISTSEDGFVYFVWDALKPLGTGNLMVIEFSAKEGAAGSTDFTFDTEYDTVAADENYNEIELIFNNKQIVIGEDTADQNQNEEKPVEPAVDENTKKVIVSVGKDISVAKKNDKKTIWFSSNERVAVVEDGVVKGLSEGFALITGETEDGEEHEVFAVTVTGEDVEGEIIEPQADESDSRSFDRYVVFGCIAAALLLMGLLIGKLFRRKRK